MTTNLFKQISRRKLLCGALAAAFGIVALFPPLFSRSARKRLRNRLRPVRRPWCILT